MKNGILVITTTLKTQPWYKWFNKQLNNIHETKEDTKMKPNQIKYKNDNTNGFISFSFCSSSLFIHSYERTAASPDTSILLRIEWINTVVLLYSVKKSCRHKTQINDDHIFDDLDSTEENGLIGIVFIVTCNMLSFVDWFCKCKKHICVISSISRNTPFEFLHKNHNHLGVMSNSSIFAYILDNT